MPGNICHLYSEFKPIACTHPSYLARVGSDPRISGHSTYPIASATQTSFVVSRADWVLEKEVDITVFHPG